MKTKYLVGTVLIFCWGFLSCQKNINDGLVAYYTFDGDARDQSANGNHGIITDAQRARDRFGNENKAYRLNGTSASIVAGVVNMPAVNAAQTISWWFMIEQPPDYIDSLGADNMIALVDSAAGIGVQFGYRAPGYGTLGLDAWYWGGRTVLELQQPVIKVWHHGAYTFDGQTHILYLDGTEQARSSVEPQTGTPNLLMFGNYPGGDQFFTGCLDEIRIYDRTLSVSEIEFLYTK